MTVQARDDWDVPADTPSTPPARDTQMWHYVAAAAALTVTWLVVRGVVVPAGLGFAAVFALVALAGGRIRRGCRRVARLLVARGVVTVPLAVAVGLWVVTRSPIATAACALVTCGILWGAHLSAKRRRELNGVVKSSPGDPWLANLSIRLPVAAVRAGLVHPDNPAVTLPAVTPPADNGVGGAVIEVDLGAIDSEPARVRAAAGEMRRGLRAAHLFVEQVGGGIDRARLHLYRGHPLEDPLPYTWLASHLGPDPGEWVPFGATATAGPALLRARYSTLLAGVTDSGKTGVELAVIRGLVDTRTPVGLLLVDNKGASGGRELRRLADVAAGYTSSSADAWPLIRAALDVTAHRHASVVADGQKLRPSAEHPLVLLVVTELWNLLQSRPPAGVRDWADYTGGRLDARPAVGEWRALLDESLTRLAREAQAVGVAFHGSVQAAQLDAFGRGSRLRTVIPQRLVLRVMTDDDIEPAIGSGPRPPAEQIPHHLPGVGYVRVGTGTPVMFRSAHISPEMIDGALVRPLRRAGAAKWTRSLADFLDPHAVQ